MAIMAHQAPLKYVFYIATTPEKVWEGFVSRESEFWHPLIPRNLLILLKAKTPKTRNSQSEVHVGYTAVPDVSRTSLRPAASCHVGTRGFESRRSRESNSASPISPAVLRKALVTEKLATQG